MAGVELYTVKEILGHKTLLMTARCPPLSPGHQREALERLTGRHTVPATVIPEPTGTTTSTGEMLDGGMAGELRVTSGGRRRCRTSDPLLVRQVLSR